MNTLILYCRPDSSFTGYVANQLNAKIQGSTLLYTPEYLTEDGVKKAQEEVTKADLIYFVHPIHWGQQPHAMKEFVDKVFAMGFAFNYDQNGKVAMLEGKQVISAYSTGTPQKTYQEYANSYEKIADDVIYSFMGMEPIKTKWFFGIAGQSVEKSQETVDSQIEELLI